MKKDSTRQKNGNRRGIGLPHYRNQPAPLFSGLFRSYTKISLRKIKSQKAVSAMIIAGLALGMTCFMHITLWIIHELSYDRFHSYKDRIFQMVVMTEDGSPTSFTPGLLGPELQKRYGEIEEYCRIRLNNATTIRHKEGGGGFHEQGLCLTDPALFRIFNFPFTQGNPETALNDPDSVVITEQTAARFFKDEDPLGQILHFDQYDADFKVTGVIKNLPSDSSLQFNLAAGLEWMGKDKVESWEPIGATFLLLDAKSSAKKLMRKIKNWMPGHGDSENRQSLLLRPLTRIHLEEIDGKKAVKRITFYAAIALIILFLGCINFINLSTAGSIKRAKEVGVRKINGARRSQIICQHLTESLVLSTTALLIASSLVLLTLPAVNRHLGHGLNASDMANPMFFLSIPAIVILASLTAGSYPAFFLSSFLPQKILKGDFRPENQGLNFKKVLMIFQFSVSIGIIICAGIVYQQLRLIRTKSLGIQKETVIMMQSNQELLMRYDEFKRDLIKNSEILNVTSASSRPVLVRDEVLIRMLDSPKSRAITATTTMVDFDFFETFDMEIIQGRDFSPDAPSDKEHACLINETAARDLGISSPLGKILRFEHPDFASEYNNLHIIGVVRDFHFRSLHQAIGPFVFRFHRPWHFRFFIKIRPGRIGEALNHIQSHYKQYFPGSPFYFEFMEDEFHQLYESEIKMGQILNIFGSIAVLISCMGLFGLASYSIERKIKEIGIRKVFGASVADIMTLTTREFTYSVLAANLFAWPAVYFIMDRWLQRYAYRINIRIGIFLAAGGLTLVLALLTIGLKAAKAAAANPVDPLRHE